MNSSKFWMYHWAQWSFETGTEQEFPVCCTLALPGALTTSAGPGATQTTWIRISGAADTREYMWETPGWSQVQQSWGATGTEHAGCPSPTWLRRLLVFVLFFTDQITGLGFPTEHGFVKWDSVVLVFVYFKDCGVLGGFFFFVFLVFLRTAYSQSLNKIQGKLKQCLSHYKSS